MAAKRKTINERYEELSAWITSTGRKPRPKEKRLYNAYYYLKTNAPELFDKLPKHDTVSENQEYGRSDAYFRRKATSLMNEMTNGTIWKEIL